jgi:cytochrome c peroxidase
MLKVLVYISIVLLCFSCQKEDEPVVSGGSSGSSWGAYDPTPKEPKGFQFFPEMHNPSFNSLTEEGVVLGKRLYYDNILGTNGLSCSSCHLPQYSYSLPVMGPVGTAILPHVNLGWYNKFGWTGSEDHLDYVALADLAEGNPFLNANGDSILNRFQRDVPLQQMFWKAFGVKIVELSVSERNTYISFALAQFLRTMVSDNSKFDRYIRGEESLTPSEASGLDVFMSEDKGDCFHCHGNPQNPLWTDKEFHNNALNATFSGLDLGRFLVTGDSNDIGKFKSPTLRNIELSAPYMHDNRFTTLEEVVDFYSENLQNSPYVDPLMQKIGQGGAHISPSQKVDLINFLKSLTDTSFINNPEILN